MNASKMRNELNEMLAASQVAIEKLIETLSDPESPPQSKENSIKMAMQQAEITQLLVEKTNQFRCLTEAVDQVLNGTYIDPDGGQDISNRNNDGMVHSVRDNSIAGPERVGEWATRLLTAVKDAIRMMDQAT